MEELALPPEPAASERGKAMNHGYLKRTAGGFEEAAQVLMYDFSDEAKSGLTRLVRETAAQYYYNDALMLRRFWSRLHTAARKQAWAREAVRHLQGSPSVLVAA